MNIKLLLAATLLVWNISGIAQSTETSAVFRNNNRQTASVENPELGHVWVKGRIKDYNRYRDSFAFVKWYVNDPILRRQIVYDAAVDSDGYFETKVPLVFSQDVMMGLGELSITGVFLNTNDSVAVEMNAADILSETASGVLKLSGISGKITNDIFIFRQEKNRIENLIPDDQGSNPYENTPDQYLRLRTVEWKRDKQLLDSLHEKNGFSAEGKKYLENDIYYNFQSDLLRYSWLNSASQKNPSKIARLPETFTKLIAEDKINNPEAFNTSAYSFSFLPGLAMYESLTRELPYSLQHIIRKWNNSHWDSLSKEQKDFIAPKIQFSNLIYIMESARKLEPGEKEKLQSLMKIKPEQWNREQVAYLEQAMANTNTDVHFGIHGKDEELRMMKKRYGDGLSFDILLAQSLEGAIENALENNATYIDTAIEWISSPLIKTKVRQDFTKAMYALRNPVIPADANLNELDANAGDSILLTLLQKHPGKALYIDFWATWCGPCIGEMPASNKLRESLKDENVVFVYLCNHSPEATWKNMISKLNLNGEHYLLNTRQTEFLYHRFGITGIPHYVLVNKNGQVVSMKAKRPSEGEQLRRDIIMAAQ